MWIITENGNARNLAHAYKLDFGEHKGKVKVYATFPICTGKNTADPAFAETAVLKTFDNADDAKEFIWDVVNMMNCDAGFHNWIDLTDERKDEKPLGYSFSWLKKLEALPAEERTKLENKIKIWLDENVVGSGTQGEIAAKKANAPTSGGNLIDGIPL
ncbi:MAG: hypothetical protein IKZ58_06420 [Selenomonadaceae bacterium]|nr:hypothetical protein [Selenomonadaceae bacterium]